MTAYQIFRRWRFSYCGISVRTRKLFPSGIRKVFAGLPFVRMRTGRPGLRHMQRSKPRRTVADFYDVPNHARFPSKAFLGHENTHARLISPIRQQKSPSFTSVRPNRQQGLARISCKISVAFLIKLLRYKQDGPGSR